MNVPFNPGRGFRDPVLGPQAFFRAMLQAMSRPGHIVAVPDMGVEGPSGLSNDVLGILLAICDHETPVWLDAELRQSPVAQWLAFHANCSVTDDPAHASFSILRNRLGNPAFASFALGDERYPDRSTTLIVLADNLTNGRPLMLEGPGIETRIRIAPEGLPDGFVEQVQFNHKLFPRGVDVLIVAGHSMCGLPRSTRILSEAL